MFKNNVAIQLFKGHVTSWKIALAVFALSTSALAEVNPPVVPPGMMTWKYEYDASGQLTKTIDPNGNVTTRSYDLLKRPRQLIQPQPKPNIPMMRSIA